MKKGFISIFFFIIVMCISNISMAESNFTLNSIDFDATLNEDGSMNVIETWKINVEGETNTLFKTFDLDKSKYSGITDVKVSRVEENGEETEFKEKNQEVLHVDKNCYYGLINSAGMFEIAWGINEQSGEKTYKVYYKIEDCIKKYNDISELYWKFIGNDFEVNIDNITGRIYIPSKDQNKSDIRVWAHGPLNGNVKIVSNDEVCFELEEFSPGDYVEIRLAMPNEIFSGITNVLNTNRMDTIITEETNLANEANRQRQELIAQKEAYEKRQKVLKIVLQIVCIIVTFIFLIKINKYDKIIKERQKLKPENPSKYYREIPRENATPAEVALLYYKSSGIENNKSKILSSTMLDLALKGFVTFEKGFDKNHKEQIIVKVDRRDNSMLKEDEKEIHELLKRIQGESSGFNIKEIEKYAKKHYEVFLGKLDKIPDLAIKQLKTEELYSEKQNTEGMNWGLKSVLYMFCFGLSIIPTTFGISIAITLILMLTSGTCFIQSLIMRLRTNWLTQKAVNEKEEWEGLKRYMEDYSKIDDREVPELVIWEKYLVYATVFGIADKVLKQLKVQYPELSNENYENNAVLGIMYTNSFNNPLISNINRAVENAYKLGISESGYSNYSSGSGLGGGFSGGGRRWRSEVAAVKNCLKTRK